jgi:hypothetical protein
MDNAGTMQVLKQLERGEIRAEEADARLNRAPTQLERDYVPRMERVSAPKWAQEFWKYPLITGIGIVFLGAWVIAATAHINALWLVLGLPMVLFGSLLIALAASMRSHHWIFINVQHDGKHHHNIRFGIPLPIGFLRGALWIARIILRNQKIRLGVNGRAFTGDNDWADLDELFASFEHEREAQPGITVDVDDKGEHVQVYFI